MTTTEQLPADVAAFIGNDSIVKYAARASVETGLWPSVILAQWGNETAWGTSADWIEKHNFAGVSSGGVVVTYPNYTAGLAAYIETMKLPRYDPVRAAHDEGPGAQCVALGQSGWAAGGYLAQDNAHPGSALTLEISDFGLARFDESDGQAAPVPSIDHPPFPELAEVLAVRFVVTAFVCVLNRTPTDSELNEWRGALAAGEKEPADLLIELSAEPQSVVTPLASRDAK